MLELLIDLNATDEQLDSPDALLLRQTGHGELLPTFPAPTSSRCSTRSRRYIPEPSMDLDKPFQMLVSSIDYNEYVGRIAIGRTSASNT